MWKAQYSTRFRLSVKSLEPRVHLGSAQLDSLYHRTSFGRLLDGLSLAWQSWQSPRGNLLWWEYTVVFNNRTKGLSKSIYIYKYIYIYVHHYYFIIGAGWPDLVEHQPPPDWLFALCFCSGSSGPPSNPNSNSTASRSNPPSADLISKGFAPCKCEGMKSRRCGSGRRSGVRRATLAIISRRGV